MRDDLLRGFLYKIVDEIKRAFIITEKGTNNGVMYATHLTRFISLLLDAIILVYTSYLIGYIYRLVYQDMFMDISMLNDEHSVINKFTVGVALDEGEKAILKTIFIKEAVAKTFKIFVTFSIFLAFNYFFRASPAKIIFRLSIIDDNTKSSDISFKILSMRYFYSIISVLVLFLGYFNCLWDIRCRAWHDRWTGCSVALRSSLPS
ncbi:RDD family protein [Anaplasmataceae bacterium AB001_6]|nr:RDD family protein [Anaplasmataceae bacterium AB001_6]